MQMLPILTLMITTVSHLFDTASMFLSTACHLFKPVSMLLSTACRHFSTVSHLFNTAVTLLSSATAMFIALAGRFWLDVSLSSVLTPLSNVIKGGGMAMLVWGGVKFFIALPNHNGPDAVNGLWCVLGGAGIIGLGTLVTSIAV